jgi:hypothetical protein
VAALLQTEDPRPGAGAAPDPLAQGLYGQAAQPAGADGPGNFSTSGEMMKGRMPDLVKGAGLAPKGGNMPLTDQADIMRRASQASLDLRMATYEGFARKSSVVKSMNQGFLNNFGALRTALETPSIGEQIGQVLGAVASPDIVRSFTAGNLGIGSTYGLTPFNLLAPSRLIYPVCPF